MNMDINNINNINDVINDINLKINEYKQKVSELELNTKKKYFNMGVLNKDKLIIKSYDDMYDVMYVKNRYYDNDIYRKLNQEYIKTGNVINDLKKIIKLTFDNKYFDDTEFKAVIKNNDLNDLNYLNPKQNEKILFNSLKKNVFQQSDFRKDLYKLEEIIKNMNFNESIKINFFEDEEYKLVWIIIEIK
jgi:hypothetical protein